MVEGKCEGSQSLAATGGDGQREKSRWLVSLSLYVIENFRPKSVDRGICPSEDSSCVG